MFPWYTRQRKPPKLLIRRRRSIHWPAFTPASAVSRYGQPFLVANPTAVPAIQHCAIFISGDWPMAEPISSLAMSAKEPPVAWPQDVSREQPRLFEVPDFAGSFHRGRQALGRSWRTIRTAASRTISRAGSRITHTTRERPLEVVAGVAAAGFALGVALRIWRSRYE